MNDGAWERDEAALLKVISGARFDPRARVILEEQPVIPPGPKPPGVADEPPRIVKYGLNRVRIETAQSTNALLVLGDSWYPGWKAYVNGKQATLYRANYVMRSVLTPPGRSTVEFRYEPWSFRVGVMVSLASLVLVLGVLIWEARRSFHRTPRVDDASA